MYFEQFSFDRMLRLQRKRVGCPDTIFCCLCWFILLLRNNINNGSNGHININNKTTITTTAMVATVTSLLSCRFCLRCKMAIVSKFNFGGNSRCWAEQTGLRCEVRLEKKFLPRSVKLLNKKKALRQKPGSVLKL